MNASPRSSLLSDDPHDGVYHTALLDLTDTPPDDPLCPSILVRKLSGSQFQCRICGDTSSFSECYRCLKCAELNICGMCFERRCESSTHRIAHPMIRYSEAIEILHDCSKEIDSASILVMLQEKYAQQIHSDTSCKCCHVSPIQGVRFQCDTCLAYDLCLTCVMKDVPVHAHTLLIRKTPAFIQIDPSDIEMHSILGQGGFGK
jgi:hypothetical protein